MLSNKPQTLAFQSPVFTCSDCQVFWPLNLKFTPHKRQFPSLWIIVFFEFAMSLRSLWHFHIQLTVISPIALPQLLFCTQTGLRSSCYMRLKCHLLSGNTSACATEDSLGAGRTLSPFSLSETSASRETLRLHDYGSAILISF